MASYVLAFEDYVHACINPFIFALANVFPVLQTTELQQEDCKPGFQAFGEEVKPCFQPMPFLSIGKVSSSDHVFAVVTSASWLLSLSFYPDFYYTLMRLYC